MSNYFGCETQNIRSFLRGLILLGLKKMTLVHLLAYAYELCMNTYGSQWSKCKIIKLCDFYRGYSVWAGSEANS